MTRYFLPAAVVLAGLVTMLLSFGHVSHTHDEIGHLGCGMELLDRGTYEIETQHPPLPRLAAALLPYLDGRYYHGKGGLFAEGFAILTSDGEYFRNLLLTRAGMLPFYVLACGGLLYLLWPFGTLLRNSALVLLAFSPAALAHFGLATTDGACAAFYILSLAALVSWLQGRKKRHLALLVLFLTLGALSKYSFLFYFLPTLLAATLYARFRGTAAERAPLWPDIGWPSLAGALGFMFFCTWAFYNFSLGPIWTETSLAAQWHPEILPQWAKDFLARHTFPFPEYFRGFLEVMAHNADGHKSFFLGEVRSDGHPLFFPVSLLTKMPLTFLFCLAAGLWLRFRRLRSAPDLRLDAALLGMLVILGVAAFSSINIGVRHVLPLLPLAAALGGYGLAQLFASRRPLLYGLLVLHVLVALLHFPNYISHHNVLAAPFAEKISVDSNLDWGQHQIQLSHYLDEHPEIESIHIDPLLQLTQWMHRERPPKIELLEPETPVTGWVAVRLHSLTTYALYDWLEAYEPEAVIEETVYLYRIPKEGQ